MLARVLRALQVMHRTRKDKSRVHRVRRADIKRWQGRGHAMLVSRSFATQAANMLNAVLTRGDGALLVVLGTQSVPLARMHARHARRASSKAKLGKLNVPTAARAKSSLPLAVTHVLRATLVVSAAWARWNARHVPRGASLLFQQRQLAMRARRTPIRTCRAATRAQRVTTHALLALSWRVAATALRVNV